MSCNKKPDCKYWNADLNTCILDEYFKDECPAKRIYISIPISNLDIHRQRMIANEISIVLKSQGYITVNSFELCEMVDKSLNDEHYYAECMGKDISELLKCDAVYFCTGWEKSNGCLLEFAAAKLYHKTIIMQ